MKVKIECRWVPMLAEALGAKELEVELEPKQDPEASPAEPTTIQSLLDHLEQHYGKGVKEALYSKDGFEPLVQIMVNGERYARSDALGEEALDEGDTVLFLMMMAGG